MTSSELRELNLMYNMAKGQFENSAKEAGRYAKAAMTLKRKKMMAQHIIKDSMPSLRKGNKEAESKILRANSYISKLDNQLEPIDRLAKEKALNALNAKKSLKGLASQLKGIL